jgi:hypothetical protein
MRYMNKKTGIILIILIILILICSCEKEQANESAKDTTSSDNAQKSSEQAIAISRESKIPTDAVKVTPQTDAHPLEMKSDEFRQPVPLSSAVNTAGAEDSPFVMPEGNTLYFFFTPDVRIPAEKQLTDGVTGVWVSNKVNGQWENAERVILQDPKKLALDGCLFVLGNSALFCSAREGYVGIHWFSAEFSDGKWKDWKNADFAPEYKVGELHISNDGNELYYHADRQGGKGKLDIWMSRKVNGEWSEPENVEAVNTERDDGWPALSPDGNELWFNRDYGVWRSKKLDGEWQAPELIVSPLAGEPTIDNQGNLYFVHHYFKDDKMIEADIYFAERK